MAVIPVSLLWRGAFGTSYGIGENYSDKKKLLTYRADEWLAGGITFDLVIDEEHSLENDVTEHPVEDGSPITDHIRNRLREGKLTGMVSNYSLFSYPLENLMSRSQKAYDALKELWKKQVPVDIVSVLEVYKNVAIKDITMKRDSESGSAQQFEITFKEVSVRKLEVVEGKTLITTNDLESVINKVVSPPANMGRQVADYSPVTFVRAFPLL